MNNKRARRNKIWIFLAALLLLVFLALSFFVVNQLKIKKLQKNLEGTIIRGVAVEGYNKKFDVIDGSLYVGKKKISPLLSPILYRKALPLANFYLVTKEDPLFASPELNAEKFLSSIVRLEKVHNQLLKELRLKREIVPLGFLKNVAEVRESEQKFLDNPSVKNAELLLKNCQAAQRDYEQELKATRRYIAKAFPPEREVEFVTLNSVTTNKLVLDDLSLMLKNAKELKEEIKERGKVLRGDEIPSFSESFPSLDVLKSTQLEEKLLPRQELNVDSYYLDKLRGPYLITTSCFGKDYPEYVYIYDFKISNYGIRSVDVSDRVAFMAKSATDNYFQRLNRNSSAEKKFIEQGYIWRPAQEGNIYRSNNLEYQPVLLTLDRYCREYKRKKLFGKIVESSYFSHLSPEAKKFFREATGAEDVFFSDKIPSEENMEKLKTYYLAGYRYLKKSKVDFEFINLKSQHQDELLKRYLLLNNKMRDLDYIFDTTLFLHNLLARAKLGLLDRRAASYLYTFRGAYSLTYFNFSPAVWRLKKRPKYALAPSKKTKELSRRRFITYKELLKSYDKTEILSWRKITERVILEGD